MIKVGVRIPEIESGYLRKILKDNIRLDGRQPNDFREVTINLTRSESCSSAEVTIGPTRALAVVKGKIITPYRDRPTEGILQINVNISIHAQSSGISQNDVSRYLEKSIRDSDAIDTESLCLVAGEKVWMIVCDIELLDYSGGAIDVCMLSCIAALRAHRRPEVSVLNSLHELKIHHSDEREPLPLALHHTPLAISIGLFKLASHESLNKTHQQLQQEENNNSNNSKFQSQGVLLVGDLSDSEAMAADGIISFSINAHRELCAINKPGGVALDVPTVLRATAMAATRAVTLHSLLTQSLTGLEETINQQRILRLEMLRKRNMAIIETQNTISSNSIDNRDNSNNSSAVEGSGSSGGGSIDRNDPMLNFAILHQPFTHTTQPLSKNTDMIE